MKRFCVKAVVDGVATVFVVDAATQADANNMMNYQLANSGAVYTIIKG